MKRLFLLNLKISCWTIGVWLILYSLGAGKIVFFCYGIMFLHELAHICAALFFGHKIEKVTVYPFGLCAQIQQTHSLHLFQRILLYGAGPFVHICMFIILEVLLKMHFISVVMSDYLCQINLNYLLFNCLPVFPLDGYHLFHALFLVVLPYRKALYMSCILSFAGIGFLWLMNPNSLIYLICTVILLMINIMNCASMQRQIRMFYLSRYLHPETYKDKYHFCDDLFVYCTNWMNVNGKIISEKQMLKKILKLEGK
ncbi:MAG: hypothetical protein J6K75_07125 [Erysipelotrichaceae bacterium]|nr:hypothetical protein [Erysipelotrichaceae bacterium]